MIQYKETRAKVHRRSAERRRKLLDELKNVPCADCGKQYPPYVMDFDHRDPDAKVLHIGRQYLVSMEKLLAEIEKCDVVCANCHRERTHKQGTA